MASLRSSFPTAGKQPPKGYVPGLGRGAAGFTTRSDIGPAASSSAGDTTVANSSGTGSRSSEIRAAKLQQQQQQTQEVEENEEDPEEEETYLDIDEILAARRKRKQSNLRHAEKRMKVRNSNSNSNSNTGIQEQFHDLKQELAHVSEADWAAIPECKGDASLRHKQNQRNSNNNPLNEGTIVSDTLLWNRHQQNANDKTTSQTTTTTTTPMMTQLAEARGTLLNMTLNKMSDSVTGQTVVDPKGYLTGMATSGMGGRSTVGGGVMMNNAEISDVNKARTLLKSVRDTNPRHGPGWIAAARVEEVSGNVHAARKLLQEACQLHNCSDNVDVWLEAARLHDRDAAKAILAAAVRRCPANANIPLFVQAAELETDVERKKAILRKALESNPHSVTLWKSAIELEDDKDHAKVLLSVAVEKVPHSVDMWLALARLSSTTEAKRVLNKARKTLPTERAIWIAAAKLEEHSTNATTATATSSNKCEMIIAKAVQTLPGISREVWWKEAEHAELQSNAVKTSAAIIQHTIQLRSTTTTSSSDYRLWAEEAQGALSRKAVATARAILAHALALLPTKRTLWMQAMELEKHHGTPTSLDQVLEAACQRMPQCELFWLMRAKELWTTQNDINAARTVLRDAFAANPNSEAVWLAAAKLEWETGELPRAQVLLSRARDRAPSGRVYMKSAILERNSNNYQQALQLLTEGIKLYPTYAKLYMMAGQISSSNLHNYTQARRFYQTGIQRCPDNLTLWILASHLEEQQNQSQNKQPDIPKARSILELARLKNPKQPLLWLHAIQLEQRASVDKTNNNKSEELLLARALQECPTSGILWKESIGLAKTRLEQKTKSTHAIQTCPDDPHVIAAVASLFASEHKVAKARKWFDRALVLDPDNGDTWAMYHSFETTHDNNNNNNNNNNTNSSEQLLLLETKCQQADPKHGEVWTSIRKQVQNERKSTLDILKLTSHHFQQQSQTKGLPPKRNKKIQITK